jgi:diaminohydroxyphosphoribosylaminopyrimidine deaminase/5-amino-6-(5-phosphoribosylamino)uracil reductase
LAASQPLAVVIGQRETPSTAQVRNAPGGFQQYHTHDVGEVLADLQARGVRHVLVEGGPTLAGAFLAAGVVDEIHAYIAPMLLGDGKAAVPPFGVGSLGDAEKFRLVKVRQLGNDVFVKAKA